MKSTSKIEKNDGAPALFGPRTLHIFTLCGFGFTQPLLVALAQQTVYLHDQQIGWLEIAALLFVLMLVIPLLFVGLDRGGLQLSGFVKGRGRNTVLMVLSGVVLLSVLRPVSSLTFVAISGFAGIVTMLVVIPSSWFLVCLYERTRWFRSWLTFASIGLLIFPISFVWQFNSLHNVKMSIEAGIPIKNPVPVIIVVFDELCGTTLLNDRMEVNAGCFPQFARLASLSTLYRNATTVHPRTQVAVPAILSGRYPVADWSPLESQYRGNLLELIESTKQFEMAVFEAATRLCPISVNRIPVPTRTPVQKSTEFIRTLAAVYPRLIFSKDIPAELPAIPKSWFGLPPQPLPTPEYQSDVTEGLFHYYSTANRDKQFQHFLNCVRNTDRPHFVFYHTVFPHFPWAYLPSGHQYEMESSAPYFPAGGAGELGEDWMQDHAVVLRNEFRYRLQLGFVDRLIGQLLDRLEETGLMDRCLLIVTADHGVSFRPGHSRRLPDAENLSDLMSVPLFIKLPGQAEGKVDDRNVESIDLLPTIAEILGLDLPEPVDGISLSKENRPRRKTLYYQSIKTVIEPDLPQRRSALRRQSEIFGSAPLDQPPAGIASHPEWNGRRVDSFLLDPQTMPYGKVDPTVSKYYEENQDKSMLVKCFVVGRLYSSLLPGPQADLVVALNGVIVDSGKSSPYTPGIQTFEFLLPQADPKANADQAEVYLVDQTEGRPRLKRLKDDLSQTLIEPY